MVNALLRLHYKSRSQIVLVSQRLISSKLNSISYVLYISLTGTFSPTKQGPRYIQGHAVTMAMILWAASVYGFLWLYLARVNRNRDAGKEDYKLEGLSSEEIAELGNESPYFRYMT